MGIVFRAEDRELEDRPVAIKVLPPELSGNEAALTRLKREAMTVLELTHPNVVRLHTFERDPAGAFLVMELVAGPTLELVLAERERLPWDEVLDLGIQAASGLEAAHRLGIVHRDVKPSNLMFSGETGTPIVKVMDFGIAAQVRDSMTRLTGIESAGTLLYCPPEQLRGERPDARGDQYSLAATLYELATGHPPFTGAGLSHQILEATPRLPVGVPEPAASALLRALSKRPEDRFPDLPAMVAALRGQTPTGEGSQRAPGPAPSADPLPRPLDGAAPDRGLRPWGTGLAAVGLLVLAGLATRDLRRPPEPAPAVFSTAPAPTVPDPVPATRLPGSAPPPAVSPGPAPAPSASASPALAPAPVPSVPGSPLPLPAPSPSPSPPSPSPSPSSAPSPPPGLVPPPGPPAASRFPPPTGRPPAPQALPDPPLAPSPSRVPGPASLPSPPPATSEPRIVIPPESARTLAAGTRVLTPEGLELAWFPPGEPFLWLESNDLGRANANRQNLWVSLEQGFFLATAHVTNALFDSLVADDSLRPQAERAGDLPRRRVTWHQAIDFCRLYTARGHAEGWLHPDWEIRLPSEAEWVFAMRYHPEAARIDLLSTLAGGFDWCADAWAPDIVRLPQDGTPLEARNASPGLQRTIRRSPRGRGDTVRDSHPGDRHRHELGIRPVASATRSR